MRLHRAARLLPYIVGACDGRDVVRDELLHRADHDLGRQLVLGSHVFIEARAADTDGGSD
ncbi:hypothetical protein OG568_47280 [Streptomyces sp. NBC_01450]|uniref:hypothetical protein n=1 Tax=Streptomyces sp. NBC_01450 TaxID=2903871 RepID=UPI002E350F6D|nr:hypothetical protein [Streptomyces sp. NBC_01450]